MNPLPDMTASASVLIVCTVILRAIFIHRLPKQTFTVLWLIAALRLLIPFSAPVNLGIPQPVHEAVYRIQTAETLQNEPAQTATASETKPDIPASADTGETGDAPQTGLDASQFELPLWLAGAGITLTVFLLRHRRVLRRCRESIPAHCPTADSLIRKAGIRRSVQVRVCQTLATPLTFGLIKPVILLPKSLDTSNPDRLSCILTHELVHIKRLHVLYKYILTLAVCVHWFNPLAWVMLLLANRDLELSCDQAVLSLSGSNRQSYALTLIAMEETRGLSPLSSGFGANAVEERIRSIMKYRKTGISGIMLSIVLVLGAVTAFATGESKESNHPQETSISAQSGEFIQYICEPAYYTAEEFRDAMSDEKNAIEAEVDAGTLTLASADEMLRVIDSQIQAAEDGTEFQRPVPVYYTDGSPVVNSRGEQLYAKASDIEECNREILYRYHAGESVATAEQDTITEIVLTGTDTDDNPDTAENVTDIHWYTYEEYALYVQEMKAAYKEMEGEWIFNPSDGWYEWTAADTDNALACLEQTLESIKNGHDVGISEDGALLLAGYETDCGTTYETADLNGITTDAVEMADTQADDSIYAKAGNWDNTVTAMETTGALWDGQDLSDYSDFGISADHENQYYLYDGKPVAGFADIGHYVLTDSHAKDDGGIYVAADRSAWGRLTGIREISTEEFLDMTGLTM